MGLLEGFIGGAAQAGQNILAFDREREARQEDRRAEMDYSSQLEIQRQRTLEVLRQEHEAAAEKRKAAAQEATDKRNAEISIGAREDAEVSLRDAGFQKFKKDVGATDMSDDDLLKVYRENYHDQTVGDFAGADRYDVKESDRAKAELNSLTKRGAGSGLLNSANANVKDALTRERQATIDALNVRKQGETERRNRELEQLRWDQNEIASRRVEAAIKAGAPSATVEQMKVLDSQRKDLATNLLDLRSRKQFELERLDKNDRLSKSDKAIKEAEINTRYGEAEKKINDKQDALDRNLEALSRSVGLGGGAAKDAPKADTKPTSPGAVLKSLPAGAKVVGTSGGKRVYEVSGKKYIEQ